MVQNESEKTIAVTVVLRVGSGAWKSGISPRGGSMAGVFVGFMFRSLGRQCLPTSHLCGPQVCPSECTIRKREVVLMKLERKAVERWWRNDAVFLRPKVRNMPAVIAWGLNRADACHGTRWNKGVERSTRWSSCKHRFWPPRKSHAWEIPNSW